MTRTTQLFAAAALGLLLGASACNNDEVIRPASTTPIDPLFNSYVALGNSITSGFQSGGINDSTQLQAYPVLLAHAMRAPFFVPLMNRPGCPPPFTNVFAQTRLTPPGYPTSTGTSCYLRKVQNPPPPYISNTAVPGAEVLDIYNNLDTASNSNTLTTFFLGGLTQAQMMQRAHPTFVTAWIGNNDVLGAATNAANGGDSTKITPVATFTARYDALIDTIEVSGARRAVLIGVANVASAANRTGLAPGQLPANGAPYFSYGSTYFTLDSLGLIPGPFTATANCRRPRGDSVLVPFPFGGALISAGATLDCTEPQTIQPAELRKLVTTVTAYNAYLATQAGRRAWVFFDPNPTLDSLRAIPTQVAAFPNFGAPGTPTPCSASPFGLAFSCDGIHPSASTHRLIANKLRQAINGAYGTLIPLTF